MSYNYKIQKEISYSLSFGIKKYIKNLEKNNKNLFEYSNINLKNPIKNYLYIKCRSEHIFMEIFESILNKSTNKYYIEDEHIFQILDLINKKKKSSKVKLIKIRNKTLKKKFNLDFFFRIFTNLIKKIINYNSFLVSRIFSQNIKTKNIQCLCYSNNKIKTKMIKKIFDKSNIKYNYIGKNILDYLKFNLPINKTLFLKKNKKDYSKKIEKIFTVVCDLTREIIETYKYFSPKTVLSFEGDTVFESISNEVCKLYKINSLCIQWGTQMYEPIKLSNESMNFHKFYVWDEFHKKYYKKYNKKPVFKIGGYPFIDRIHDSKKEKKILFGLRPRSQAFSDIDLKNYLKLIRKIIISCPDWNVIVRLHHNMDYTVNQVTTYLKGLKYHLQGIDVDLQNALSKTSIVCGVHSSLLIDGFFFKCVPISINNLNFNLLENVNFERKKTGIVINSYDNAAKEIIKLMSNKKRMNFYRNNIKKETRKVKNFENLKKMVLKDIKNL